MNICLRVCTFLVAVLFVIYAVDVQDDRKSNLEELLWVKSDFYKLTFC